MRVGSGDVLSALSNHHRKLTFVINFRFDLKKLRDLDFHALVHIVVATATCGYDRVRAFHDHNRVLRVACIVVETNFSCMGVEVQPDGVDCRN